VQQQQQQLKQPRRNKNNNNNINSLKIKRAFSGQSPQRS
jgi:hypothetical protein